MGTRLSVLSRALAVPAVVGLLASACAGSTPRSAGPITASPQPVPSAAASTDPSPSGSPSPRPKPTHHVNSPAPKPPATSPPTPPSEPGIPGSLLGTQWYTLPTTQRVVALTFDAGANADGVPSILQTLADKDVPATFFLTGKWVEVYPDYAAEIGANYPVANHSYSHPDLTTLSDGAVEDEITKGAAAIAAAIGRDTHPMFRFPFGASDQRTIDIVNALGYGAINWTVDTRGWQGTSGGQSVQLIVDRVLAALQPGEIVIMHVGSHPTDHSTLDADALAQVIDELRARGYGFVTIDQYL